jgi:hypothetical protein
MCHTPPHGLKDIYHSGIAVVEVVMVEKRHTGFVLPVTHNADYITCTYGVL